MLKQETKAHQVHSDAGIHLNGAVQHTSPSLVLCFFFALDGT